MLFNLCLFTNLASFSVKKIWSLYCLHVWAYRTWNSKMESLLRCHLDERFFLQSMNHFYWRYTEWHTLSVRFIFSDFAVLLYFEQINVTWLLRCLRCHPTLPVNAKVTASVLSVAPGIHFFVNTGNLVCHISTSWLIFKKLCRFAKIGMIIILWRCVFSCAWRR